LGTRGAVSSAVERSDSMFGSWRKLPDGAQPMHPGQHLKARKSTGDVSECAGWVRGQGEARAESSLIHASTRLGARISTIQIYNDATAMGACSERMRVSMFD